jgi:hypothetical protein
MGDISRHRDIFLNTRRAIPPALLAKCKLAPGDLTYLELGNYFTDVSQFRDPVTYIFAKQRVWRDKILPKVQRKSELVRALTALIANAGAAALLVAGRPKNAGVAAVIGALTGFVSNDLLADVFGLDDWIDKMLGNPFERVNGTKRPDKAYGYVGQFFQHFIEGITHLLFAAEIPNRVSGEWRAIDRIPEAQVSVVFKEFFTQYYPHEHTDQPPYVWDASERPKPQHSTWYGRSTRQDNLVNKGGIMNAVDSHYIQYLSEELSKLEDEFRRIKPEDTDTRRKWLVRMGKILHGIEDWYFHSNIVELIRLRSHKPVQREGEDSEQFVHRFVREVLADADPPQRVRLQRRLYRRLRFPVYERGNRKNSAGMASRETSTLSLDHAYPAFPSQQDTSHTLLAALENLERKTKPGSGSHKTPSELPPWVPCVLQKFLEEGDDARKLLEEKAQARGVSKEDVALYLASPGGPKTERMEAVVIDVLREWLPLVVTLLNESERQRLVADVAPLLWPPQGQTPPPRSGTKQEPKEIEEQFKRHKKALKPKTTVQGISENNYQRAARYLYDCEFINVRGRQALVKAFDIDQESQKLSSEAPGSGGFLMQFAVELQQTLDEGDAAMEQLNNKPDATFDQATDNGAFTEIVGSHSLMSKDTLASSPFFDDAKVLASVASQSVFHIMLDAVSMPADDRALYWPKILQHFIRYPVESGGWERRAMMFFRENSGKIPTFADLPELARLAQSARVPAANLEPWRTGTKAIKLEDEYIKLERKVSHYRYP